VTTMDTSDQALYVIDAKDSRGFDVDATLSVSTTPEGVVTATIAEATTGTASGKDELTAVAVGVGSVVVKVFDPANPDTIFGSDSIDVTPGGVATVTLGTPTISEQPVPVP
jgi:hypothetical protein